MTLQHEANQKSLDIILRHFESPDETREFPKGRFDTVTIGDTVLGRRPMNQVGSGQSMSDLP